MVNDLEDTLALHRRVLKMEPCHQGDLSSYGLRNAVLPLTFVIYATAAYRILKINLLNEPGEAHSGREFMAMDLTDPTLDFAKMAESMGVRGQRVERSDDLAGALKDAIAHPGPSLVEVVVDGPIPDRH